MSWRLSHHTAVAQPIENSRYGALRTSRAFCCFALTKDAAFASSDPDEHLEPLTATEDLLGERPAVIHYPHNDMRMADGAL
jgi:hypothetical protein